MPRGKHSKHSRGPKRSKKRPPPESEAPRGWRAGLRRWWKVICFVTVLVTGGISFIADVGGLRSQWLDSKEPSLGLALYEQEGGQFQLLEHAREIEVSPDDVFANRLRLPVQIAVTNRDQRRLEVVRVTLRYPADIKVTSAGRAQIDPTGRTIVYEHDIGVLEAVGDFTPIAPLDEMVVPFNFTVVPTVVLAKGGVPVYLVAVAGAGAFPYDTLEIPVDVTVNASNRPPVQGHVVYRFEPGVQLVSQGDGHPDARAPTDNEAAGFRAPPGRPVDDWSRPVNEEGDVVHYRKFENDSAVIQVIAVNDVLRRLIADTDGDGNVDYELVDDSGDGAADEFVTYSGGTALMVDWPPKGAGG